MTTTIELCNASGNLPFGRRQCSLRGGRGSNAVYELSPPEIDMFMMILYELECQGAVTIEGTTGDLVIRPTGFGNEYKARFSWAEE